ncbi:hypothetical protein [Brevundimonas sp.]|uniref:hypothetical protein n=1 Tax=Brevundimonas sp. TaxID=1871086 RepID=UPI00286C19DF|nr:hypothetical protein [Brevundimonas sp.]
MTVVNWWLQPNAVVIVTDTLMTDEHGTPAAFVQKAHPIPHLDAVISGRGDASLIAAWAAYAATRVIARDFDVLSEIAPAMIRNLRDDGARQDPAPSGSTSIFMWGWSPRSGRFMGYAYRSGSSFIPELLEDGVMCAPGFEDPCEDIHAALHGENVPRALIDALRQQYLECRRNPDKAGRNNCGGDAMVTSLLRSDDGAVQTLSTRVLRFAAYGTDYDAALTLAGL